ncbi:hypothetical protein Ddye_003606 [Dipteronia dyeriana]|uniref:Glycosyltransferase n=1 Tax=Dipteronia dyeriana TaxID=168575 RepID=A0AAD9XT49_9ROSI|nr:hypothetical protein Ddye_003606 [Dipteronia dyeriana]
MMSTSEIPQLHVMFLPFLGLGHMIPTLDMAKLFGARGVKTTIVTTPVNSPVFSKAIHRISKDLGVKIGVKIIKFPCVEVGLPDGCENVDAIPKGDTNMEMTINFLKAVSMLQEPVEQLLSECKPNCLVADMFFTWANESASKFGIPRLFFNGSCSFSLCVAAACMIHEPHKLVSPDSEQFVVPGLPGDIKFTRKQFPEFMLSNDDDNEFAKLLKKTNEEDLKSYGVVVNSFYELEPAYADYCRNVLGKKAWHIGPVWLCNRNFEDKAWRGKQSSIDEHECLKWLSSKKPDSVVYICFGTLAEFSSAQLKEIALGIEASGQDFVWVVRKNKKDEDGKEEWLPEGFEKRIEGKGLIIRGWAPQGLILEHESIGGMVTHCGWNSTLEGVSAGVPMVTWPLFADQFYNEKLLTQVLKIGVSVGVQEMRNMGVSATREAIEKALKEIMVGDEAEEMKKRAKSLGLMARRAVEDGGSSCSDLNALIQELSSL